MRRADSDTKHTPPPPTGGDGMSELPLRYLSTYTPTNRTHPPNQASYLPRHSCATQVFPRRSEPREHAFGQAFGQPFRGPSQITRTVGRKNTNSLSFRQDLQTRTHATTRSQGMPAIGNGSHLPNTDSITQTKTRDARSSRPSGKDNTSRTLTTPPNKRQGGTRDNASSKTRDAKRQLTSTKTQQKQTHQTATPTQNTRL